MMVMGTVMPSGEAAILQAVPEHTDYYVYYRVRAENAERLLQSVCAMQKRLLQYHGIAGSLKRRPQLRDGMHTWMEVYPAVAKDFDALLTAEVQQADLAKWIDGERHVEHFWDISSCA
jgi:hypothetical protein